MSLRKSEYNVKTGKIYVKPIIGVGWLLVGVVTVEPMGGSGLQWCTLLVLVQQW